MLKSKSFVLLILLAVLTLQSCGIKARLAKADKRYALGEYAVAGDLYKSVYSRIPSKNKPLRAEIAFKQGECYRLINHYRAEQVYQNAVRNKSTNDTVYLRLAQMQQRNGKYADAAKSYTSYLEKHPEDELALNGLQATALAAEMKASPTRYLVKKSKEFNISRSSTFSPLFSGSEGDVLIFTSNRKFGKKNVVRKNNGVSGQPNNHLFMTRKNNKGKWEAIEPLEGDVTSLNDEGIASITSDGRSMYFTRSLLADDKGGGTLIVLSNRAGGTWSAPQKVTIFKDSTISVGHPAITPDGTTMYFVSDSKEGLGGKDIWRATYEGGEWKYIENLGKDINTPDDEMFPTVREDGTLYYSSKGKPGMGGLDIFKATPLKEGGWEVKNMGVPVNSPADDFGMAFAGKTESGYFSSNRNESRGYDALWSFELPALEYVLQGKITDRVGETVADAKIRIIGNNGENARIQAKGDGTYSFKMTKGVDYVMLASARGFLNQKNEISTRNASDRQSESFKVDFQLTPLFKPVQMDNIFYEFAKWNLTPQSETGLQQLVKLLNDNPNITIEMSAHTDYVGNNESNRILSERRAQSVVDYLIKAGIDKKRLTAVGYGEEQPFTVDINTAKKYNFLKENTVLTEAFIQTLTPVQQEIANQINRRTEFRVLKTNYNLY
ncbi:MAG TPA: OmpA family protein [Paludibacteraceae bacterium]|nr:OmpA family protein [Paludibacteraceae bacterium]